MPPGAGAARFGVRFDELAFTSDLGHGRWRMVFEVLRDKTTGELVLSYLAFGVAHPAHPWQPSVYRVAHGRLHAPADQPDT